MRRLTRTTDTVTSNQKQSWVCTYTLCMNGFSLTVRKYSDMSKIRLAIFDCGAVARIHHLPVIALSDQADVTVLVDKFLPYARQLAEHHHIPAVADDYREVIGQVDAALVALPNYLHARVTT